MSVMRANIENILKQAGPDLQVREGAVNQVNVNNILSALRVKSVCGAAQRRNLV